MDKSESEAPVTGDGGNEEGKATSNPDTLNDDSTSAMEVDNNDGTGESDLKIKNEKSLKEEQSDETSFVVLEEDDGEDDDDEGALKIDEQAVVEVEAEGEKKSEQEPEVNDSKNEAESKENSEKTETETTKAEKKKSVGEDSNPTITINEDSEIVVNPLFGKPLVSVVPLIDIESSDSSGDESGQEEDYSEDVDINNLEGNPEGAGANNAAWTTTQMQKARGRCRCNCAEEKGILISEIERLRKAVFELSERSNVIEDYVEVEFGESFEKYLRNREHLVQMGFGGGGNSTGEVTGTRSAKSVELVELLKMIKEQASENAAAAKNEGKSSTDSKPYQSSSGQKSSSSSSHDRKGSVGGGGGGASSNRNNYPSRSGSGNQSKTKPIPSLMDMAPRDNRPNSSSVGRGGALAYGSTYGSSSRPVILSPNANAINTYEYQHQQQLLAQQQQQQLLAQQQQYYSQFDNMYSNVIAGGPPRYGLGRDFVTAVQRSTAYGTSASGLGNGGGYKYQQGQGFQPPQSRETKRQRKRKRKAEVSSEASVSSTTGASEKSTAPKAPQSKPTDGQEQTPKQTTAPAPKTTSDTPIDDDDIVVIDFEQTSDPPQAKRICPVCSKILNRKTLRDHLIVIHQNQRLECPICKEECFQRNKLKTHMKNEHDLPASEYSAYLDHMYKKINLKIGPWLDSMVKEAKIPTLDQLVDHNLVIENEKPPKKAVPSTSASAQANQNQAKKIISSNGAPKTTPSARITRGGNSSERPSISTAGNSSSRVRYYNPSGSNSAPTASDMYGPGGYAQYAAQFLQQRTSGAGSSSSSKLYTPF